MDKKVSEMSFDDKIKQITLFTTESNEKNEEVVAEEIRDFIKSLDLNCLGEYDNEIEYLRTHIPDIQIEQCEWSHVISIDFFCQNKYCREHDADWHTFEISFYGIWGGSGVFQVSLG